MRDAGSLYTTILRNGRIATGKTLAPVVFWDFKSGFDMHGHGNYLMAREKATLSRIKTNLD